MRFAELFLNRFLEQCGAQHHVWKSQTLFQKKHLTPVVRGEGVRSLVVVQPQGRATEQQSRAQKHTKVFIRIVEKLKIQDPDLNPIEILRQGLKRAVHKQTSKNINALK